MAKVAKIAENIVELIQIKRYDAALEIISKAVLKIGKNFDWHEYLEVFASVPNSLLISDARWAGVFTRVLVGVRAPRELLEFCQKFLEGRPDAEGADVLVDQAWGLYVSGVFGESRKSLEAALPHLKGTRLGVGWRRLGLARFELGEDWKEAFERARPLLEGRLLGIALLDEGTCWQRLGEGSKAREIWTQALGELAQDPFHLAWVRYSLGDSALRDGLAEAEAHFLEAERLTRRATARAFRSRAWQGLGTFRRAHGEWVRAVAAYREAIRAAVEPDDLCVAHWSLGRCYRLMDNLATAREEITKALQVSKGAVPAIYLEQAALNLASGDSEGAREALSRCPSPKGQHATLARILSAELARRDASEPRALHLVENIGTQALVAREEASRWPALFELALSTGMRMPQPLSYPRQLTVRVQTLGLLQVFINSRPLDIAPTSRAGELLVALLENRGKAPSTYLVGCLWPGSNLKRKRQALWQLVEELRALLGWPNSVIALRKAYQLDPGVAWDYDLEQERKNGLFGTNFLQGIESDWVSNVRRELEQLVRKKG